MEKGILGFQQITPDLSRIHNIGEHGLHSDQVYAKLKKEQKYPVAKQLKTDWTQLELHHLSHDGSVYQVRYWSQHIKSETCKQFWKTKEGNHVPEGTVCFTFTLAVDSRI